MNDETATDETPAPDAPQYAAAGDVITAESTIDLTREWHIYTIIADGTRWCRGRSTLRGTEAEKTTLLTSILGNLERVGGRSLILGDVSVEPFSYFLKYLAADAGSASELPVNPIPYVEDYRLVLGTFTHQAVSTPEPKLKQILSADSRQMHPDDPHDDASAHAYGTMMDWVRGTFGMLWYDMEAWLDMTTIGDGAYEVQETLVKRRFGMLCADCGAANYIRRLHLNMSVAQHRATILSGGYYGMDRTSKPWGVGPLYGSKPGGMTVAGAHAHWVAGFEKALNYYDDNDLGNVPPRERYDRPLYIPEHFYPPHAPFED